MTGELKDEIDALASKMGKAGFFAIGNSCRTILIIIAYFSYKVNSHRRDKKGHPPPETDTPFPRLPGSLKSCYLSSVSIRSRETFCCWEVLMSRSCTLPVRISSSPIIAV